MLNNKQLAEELITRCAGVPSPYRGMILEASRRLLQMVPDDPAKAGAMEADSLRQLAAEWPVTNERYLLMTSDEWLRCVCTAAADRIDQMSEAIDYGRKIQAEGVRLKAELEKVKQERDAAVADMRDFAEDVAHQFGYHGQHNGRLALTHGGLSTLEWAFDILGWENPHPDPENECQYEGCHHYASCGTATKDGYLRVCGHHLAMIRSGVVTALSIKSATDTNVGSKEEA